MSRWRSPKISVDPTSGAATITLGGTTAAIPASTGTPTSAARRSPDGTLHGPGVCPLRPGRRVALPLRCHPERGLRLAERGRRDGSRPHDVHAQPQRGHLRRRGSTGWAGPISGTRSTTRSPPPTPTRPRPRHLPITSTTPPLARPVDPNAGKLMTTDVIDSTTGTRVMVPVVDANGNPVPVTDANGNFVKNLDGTIQYQMQVAVTGQDAARAIRGPFPPDRDRGRRRPGVDHRLRGSRHTWAGGSSTTAATWTWKGTWSSTPWGPRT